MPLNPLTPPDGLRTHHRVRVWTYYLHLVEWYERAVGSDCWSTSPAHWDHYAVKTGDSIRLNSNQGHHLGSSNSLLGQDCIPPLAWEGEAI